MSERVVNSFSPLEEDAQERRTTSLGVIEKNRKDLVAVITIMKPPLSEFEPMERAGDRQHQGQKKKRSRPVIRFSEMKYLP